MDPLAEMKRYKRGVLTLEASSGRCSVQYIVFGYVFPIVVWAGSLFSA